MLMIGDDVAPLPPSVDQGQTQCDGGGHDEAAPATAPAEVPRRKVGKQPPPAKPQGKASSKAGGKKKLKTKSAAKVGKGDEGEEEEHHDDDDDGQGYDDDDDDAQEKDRRKIARVAKEAKPKPKLRDASKGKKFMELFHSLPGDIKQHWSSLSRSEQTDFVHSGVERSENGRLSLNVQSLWKMKMKKEEQQRSQEKLSGCVLEDQHRPKQTKTPLHPPYLIP